MISFPVNWLRSGEIHRFFRTMLGPAPTLCCLRQEQLPHAEGPGKTVNSLILIGAQQPEKWYDLYIGKGENLDNN